MLWVPKAHQDLCRAGSWDNGAPGLPDWLLYHTCLCSVSPYTSRSSMLNSPLLCFAVALISQVLALLGPRIVIEGIQLLVPAHYQISAAVIGKETVYCVFGSVSGGNWLVSTETPSTQAHFPGIWWQQEWLPGWASSGDLVGRRTGKTDPRYTFNADRHRPVIQICDLDFSVLPYASKIKKHIFCSSSSLSFIILHFG